MTEDPKRRLLRLMSDDGRISIQELSNKMGLIPQQTHELLKQVSEEYGLTFRPEIDIDKVGRFEFLKDARMRTKRGILSEALEEPRTMGFGEYAIFIKYLGKAPSDKEILQAVGGAYVPQFICRLGGAHDLFIYAVARSYENMMLFVSDVEEKLKGYSAVTYVNKVWRTFGFFPASKSLLDQFDIFDSYKSLLVGLNSAGREAFSVIGERWRKEASQMTYAYERLVMTQILKRITYFESKPKNKLSMLLSIRITNKKKFDDSKTRWYARLAAEYRNRHSECTFMCDIPSPNGMLVIASAENQQRLSRFAQLAKSSLRGASFEKMLIRNSLLGSLGIRDCDMGAALQIGKKAVSGPVLRISANPDLQPF